MNSSLDPLHLDTKGKKKKRSDTDVHINVEYWVMWAEKRGPLLNISHLTQWLSYYIVGIAKIFWLINKFSAPLNIIPNHFLHKINKEFKNFLKAWIYFFLNLWFIFSQILRLSIKVYLLDKNISGSTEFRT